MKKRKKIIYLNLGEKIDTNRLNTSLNLPQEFCQGEVKGEGENYNRNLTNTWTVVKKERQKEED